MWFQAHHLVSRASLVWWARLLNRICCLPKNIRLSPNSRAIYCRLSGVTTWRVSLWTADVSYGGISGVSREAACVIPQWRFTWWIRLVMLNQKRNSRVRIFVWDFPSGTMPEDARPSRRTSLALLHGKLLPGDSEQWVKREWRAGQTRPSCQTRPQYLHHCPARLLPNPKEVVRTPPCIKLALAPSGCWAKGGCWKWTC